jgi:LysR family transcriptional activator of nhaA
VVQDELRAGSLVEYAVVPDLHENFYAITVQRQFASTLLRGLLQRPASDVLGVEPAG